MLGLCARIASSSNSLPSCSTANLSCTRATSFRFSLSIFQIAARQTLREQCARQQAKLDKVYDKAFDKKEHEYAEESLARRAVAAAEEDVKFCSERLSKSRSANESLREALHHALLCARAFDAAVSSNMLTCLRTTVTDAYDITAIV